MAVVLACVDGPPKGKRLDILAGKAVPIKVRKHDQDAGNVVFELVGSQCVLTNRSELPCQINGEVRQRSVLRNGDRVVIGKSTFELRIEDADGSKTQALDDRRSVSASDNPGAEMPVVDSETTISHPSKADVRRLSPGICSVCDGPFSAGDGWSSKSQRICHRCIEKGVRPDHLPRANARGNAPEPLAMPETDVVRADSVPTVIEHAAPGKSEARHAAKRISASRLSVVDSEAGGGLLKKMSSLLGNNRGDKQRMEALMKQREGILVEAGRLSMGSGGILGLPEEVLNSLLAGMTVSINPQDLSGSALDQWRSERERIMLLDTEIAALRRALGLGPDPDAILMPAPPLRAEVMEHKERTFHTLDGVSTENLDGEFANQEPASAPTPPPPNKTGSNHSSGSRRAVSLRRR